MIRLPRLIVAALLALGLCTPAHAQVQTARTYQGQDGQSKEAIGTFCVPDTAGNGCAAGGGGGTIRTTAPGVSDTQAVPVQGVTGGVPQNVTVVSALPAGTNAIGSITNTGFAVTSALPAGSNAIGTVALTAGTAQIGTVTIRPDGSANSGAVPVATTAAAGGLVVKAAAGNLYGLNVVSGASAGYVMVFPTTTVPADGAVTPAKCLPMAANTGIALTFNPPLYFTPGISVAFSTTGCFSKTASATAFISGDAK